MHAAELPSQKTLAELQGLPAELGAAIVRLDSTRTARAVRPAPRVGAFPRGRYGRLPLEGSSGRSVTGGKLSPPVGHADHRVGAVPPCTWLPCCWLPWGAAAPEDPSAVELAVPSSCCGVRVAGAWVACSALPSAASRPGGVP